ncbi:hypothetical protein HQ945_08920 [Phyllobacterium sp. BT25]|uniref:DUF6894 domain-containing protein n=1 Tax=Phyllobacterium pellucidum TaxID=2740464 RepID=A0A849VQU6_9HYPH|nr:hypothetical protein [Phyllobacterium pellucidum]NTS31374.1 hypothetical protein [Phyllobacterium pellucidum]
MPLFQFTFQEQGQLEEEVVHLPFADRKAALAAAAESVWDNLTDRKFRSLDPIEFIVRVHDEEDTLVGTVAVRFQSTEE